METVELLEFKILSVYATQSGKRISGSEVAKSVYSERPSLAESIISDFKKKKFLIGMVEEDDSVEISGLGEQEYKKLAKKYNHN